MIDEKIDILAQLLVEEGVKYAFGVAGSGKSLQLITALDKKSINYFPVSHEATAALAAGACCRQGKIKAVAIAIKGPGFANLIPGILSNYYEGRPAVTISEAYGVTDPAFSMHKRLDHYAVSAPIVKGYLGSADFKAVQDLLRLGQQEFPGPVHIDLCDRRAPCMAKIDPTQEKNSDDKIEGLLRRIKKANKPVLLLGSLVARAVPGLMWQQASVPVATTAAAKGCIDENNFFAAGVVTGEGKAISVEQSVFNQADLIVAIGLRKNEVVKAKPLGAPIVMVDVLAGSWGDGFDPIERVTVSDLAPVALSICAELSKKSWGEDIVAQYRAAVDKELLADEWLPARVFHCIQGKASPESILVMDTGLFCTIAETVWKAATAGHYCGSSNGRFMGTSIPTAIGVSIDNPLKPVICVCGDGGIRPYFTEIRIAVEHKLPILFVFMSDGGYGTIAAGSFDGALAKAFVINDVSWWRVCEAMGCPVSLVTNITQFQNAISQWGLSRGPLFIEMHFDAQEYRTMTKRLR